MTPVLEIPADPFPNRLATASRPDRRIPAAPRVLLALFLLALAPRALMAVRVNAICYDGVLYLHLAERFEQGDLEGGLGTLGLNTYPAILGVMMRLGLDGETAGKWWGVLVASAVVLPLFGWVRRQFDDRVAAMACVVYAVHPKFIEWSPEIIRDPTFWFLLSLCVYLLWRAVEEIRLAWYLAAGVAIALAVHTRFEGWALFVPVVLWSAWRMVALPHDRGRLAFGVLTCVACIPLFLVAVNTTLLREHPHWEWGNFERVGYVVAWADKLVATETPAVINSIENQQPATPAQPNETPRPEFPASPGDQLAEQHKSDSNQEALPKAFPGQTTATELPATVNLAPVYDEDTVTRPPTATRADSQPPAIRTTLGGHLARIKAGRAATQMSTGEAIWKLLETLRRGLCTPFALLAGIGIWCWCRTWIRRDFQPLVLYAYLVIAGMWVHLWYAQASSSRYALSILLLASPFAGLGLLKGAMWLPPIWAAIGGRREDPSWRSLAVTAILFGLWGCSDALTSGFTARRNDAAIGHWMRHEFGPGQRYVLPPHLSIAGHYADGQVDLIPQSAGPPQLTALIASVSPKLLVLSERDAPVDQLEAIALSAVELGYQPLNSARLPHDCDVTGLTLLVPTATDRPVSGNNTQALSAEPPSDGLEEQVDGDESHAGAQVAGGAGSPHHLGR